jgi:Domain of unknown function (DUF4476)
VPSQMYRRKQIMKKIFTTIIAASLSVLAFAGARPAVITVTNTDQPQFRVVVDGRSYETSRGAVVIRDVFEGNHNLSVYQVNNRSVFGNSKLMYSTALRVQAGSELNIFLDKFGQAKISSSFPDMNNRRDDDRKYGRDDDRNYGRDNDRFNTYFNQPMDVQSFWDAQRKIESKSADMKRMKIAKKVIDDNYVTTSQVKEMMDLIAFDGYKLELAKYSYSKVVDHKNFFLLKNALQYDQNKKDFNEFIEDCE